MNRTALQNILIALVCAAIFVSAIPLGAAAAQPITVTVSGKLLAAGGSLPKGTQLLLQDCGGKTQVLPLDADGSFAIDLAPGEYILTAADDGKTLLPNDRLLTIAGGGPMPLGEIVLYQGDTNGDGRVNAADVAAMVLAFGTADDSRHIDLNGDGRIDEADLALVAFSFNQRAAAPVSIAHPGYFENFITRDGDKLMDGDTQYRFISLATSNLFVNESQRAGDRRFPDEYELRDSLNTIVQLGGQVTRPYTLTYRSEQNGEYEVHIESPDAFNEAAFETMDLMLKLANELGVRVMLPFINHQNYLSWGGVESFEKMMGDPFFTGEKSKEGFKKVLSYVLNRTNTLTGVKYKDDPAIFAWQMGNELQYSVTNIEEFYAWESEMAAYVKSIDPNHLIVTSVSVEQGQNKYVELVLDDPNIDIVDAHYYEAWTGNQNLSAWVERDRARTQGKKPFIVSEFGLGNIRNMDELLFTAIQNGTAGLMLWGIRPHNRLGGFYYHNESPDTTFRFFQSYHWPGFANGEQISDEKWLEEEIALLALLRKYAYAIRGIDAVPPLPVPATPVMLASSTFADIRWQGATGARYYIVERAQSAEGPWTVIDEAASDVIIYGGSNNLPAYFSDTPDTPGTYYYRVSAVNESGASAPSEPVAVRG